MEPQPVKLLARLINGALLEAAFFVAVSDDPEATRDEVWVAWSTFWAVSYIAALPLKGRTRHTLG